MTLAEILPPPVLFFALGFAATLLRSDLAAPEALAKALSLCLMMAIGLKGAMAVAEPGAAAAMLPALGVGVALSALLPLPAYALLRAATGLDRATAAVSAHYGSVSVVTFAAAAGLRPRQGRASSRARCCSTARWCCCSAPS